MPTLQIIRSRIRKIGMISSILFVSSSLLFCESRSYGRKFRQ
jgi:hypothetical protein